jgi:hypothetical protein
VRFAAENSNALTVILALVHAAFVVSLFGALMRLLVAKVSACLLSPGSLAVGSVMPHGRSFCGP